MKKFSNKKLQLKQKIKSTLFIIVTIFWMVTIFSFSAENGTQSGSLSRQVIEVAGTLLVPEYNQWNSIEKENFIEKLQYPVRKLAHGTEYAILAILLWNTCYSFRKSSGKSFWIAVFSGAAYAALDEFHQLFVPGRNGQLLDVGIDSIGVILGAGACVVVWKIIKNCSESR